MGIYPSTSVHSQRKLVDGSETWVETVDDFSGQTQSRRVTATSWQRDERTDCFCCSCREDSFGYRSNDAACRNHGFAALRPCEEHGMPGQAWDDMDDFPESGTMPRSVQAERAVHNSALR